MEKKYQLRYDRTKEVNGRTLYRIQALKSFNNVKEGEFGGYIESEENLSQKGKCWIYDNACVFDKAVVENNARIGDKALVYDNAIVKDKVQVYDNAMVYGNAELYGNAVVHDNGKIYDYAKIYDRVRVYHDAKVYGHAIIHAKSDICNTAEVCGNANLNHVLCTFGKHLGDEKVNIEDKENVTIQVPDGYEIDKENSTFECIKFKKKKEQVTEIHTWYDLVDSRVKREYYDATYGLVIKSLIAKFKIEKLMLYFGGVITDEEWHNQDIKKFVIEEVRDNGEPCLTNGTTFKTFLAFHTAQDAYNFMSYSENVQLVKDYFMMD